MKIKKCLSMLLAIILVAGCITVPSVAESSNGPVDELSFDPAPVVKDGDSYKKAEEGDTNVRYRVLRSFAAITQSYDGGKTWISPYYAPASGTYTNTFTVTIPSDMVMDVAVSPYSNMTPWRGLYYPPDDSQGIEESDSELADRKTIYDQEVYGLSGNIYSVTMTTVIRCLKSTSSCQQKTSTKSIL